MRRFDWRPLVPCVAALLFCLNATAQAVPWTVKPEWVRAHESFLASDVLAGRGSATRDEQIAATYVASRFESYGLLKAPGMAGYLQVAPLSAPALDEHASFRAGSLSLEEGPGFSLLVASGRSVSGTLKKSSDSNLSGAIVLVLPISGKDSLGSAQPMQHSGAAALIVVADDSTTSFRSAAGGQTRVPITLEGAKPRNGSTILTVSKAIMAQMLALPAETAAALDLHPLPGSGRRQTFNAVGYLPGTLPAAGTILLTAHLDHLGVAKTDAPDNIFNGADDDASGTTAVLELAHALAAGPPLRRGILFVCYGSEEIGGLGSTWFGMHPPVSLTQIVANLELEMIGVQDPKMKPGVLLLTGWERSNLGPTLREHGALLGPDPYPEEHYFERSDNYSLALRGVVAHTAAGWGDTPIYHSPSDDIAHLHLPFMTAAIQSLIEPIRWLANSDFKPAWNPGGQPAPR